MTLPETTSPFATAFAALSGLGYHCIPLMAKSKAPGDFRRQEWRPAFGWQKYRDRAATSFETGLWARNWPDANIGVILGTRHGDKQLVAVDFDVTDPDILDEFSRCIPQSPMRKRGNKGFTAFYLAPLDVRSQKIPAGEAGHIDILTGNETRQTVMPPSVHPSGIAYTYVTGPVAVADLPVLSAADLERLTDTAACWLPADAPIKRVVSLQPAEGPFAELNSAALENLSAWVPELDGLHNLQRKASGYMAVAAFRPSSSGRALSARKQNLSITVHGIKDFGTDTPYSPLDLVMAANGVGFDAAFAWLSDRINPVAPLPAMVVAPVIPAPVVTPHTVPGLVGDIAQWITETAIKPQPALSLFAALTIVGTVIGRRMATPYQNGGTHLYAVGLTASGGGKDHPRAACMTLLKAAGFSHLIGPGEFISMPAVVKRLMRGPLMLCAMDEFGAFLGRVLSKKASVFERAISKTLREAWSSSFTQMQTPEWAGLQSETITAPAMSIFGVSTVEEFWSGLQGADIKNGLLNRFLLTENHIRPHQTDPQMDRLFPPQELIASIAALAGPMGVTQASTAIVEPKPLSWGQGTREAFRALASELEARGDNNPDEQDYLQRTAEMALRIGTIIAAGRGSQSVSLEDFRIGRDLGLASAETMIRGSREHMAETDYQAQSRMVLGIIRKAGKISRSALYRQVDHRIDSRALDSILKSLVDAETIVEGADKAAAGGTGRPTKAYAIRAIVE